MTDPVPSTDDAYESDGRLASIVALVLLLVGTAVAVTGVMLAFGVPAGLILLGALLLGAGIVLGLE